MLAGDDHAWDCLNDTYGVTYAAVGGGGDVWRIDGIGLAMRVTDVYAPLFKELYEALPGFGGATSVAPIWAEADPFANTCDDTGTSFSLVATTDVTGALSERT